jgi:hypothetical protein
LHLHLADPIYQSDVIMAENSGSVEIRLQDGSSLMLRPGSRLKINERMVGVDEATSVMLFWGRLMSRVLTGVGEDRYSVETPTLVARIRGTEFEVGVAEDQGGLVSVYHGKVEVEAQGEKVPLGPQKEVEVDFMEKPRPPRSFKEKTEHDWAGWMVSRSHDLSGRLPDLTDRMARRAGELQSERQQERGLMEKRLQEMEGLTRKLEEARGRGETQAVQEMLSQHQELSREHRQSVRRLQQMENQLQAAHWHAERLLKRSKGMKRELGSAYGRVTDGLKAMEASRKEVQKGLAEDRRLMKQHRIRAKELLDTIPEAKVTPQGAQEKGLRPMSPGDKPTPQEIKKGPADKEGPRSSVQRGRPGQPPGKPGIQKQGERFSEGKGRPARVEKAPAPKKAEVPAKGKKAGAPPETEKKKSVKKKQEKEKPKKGVGKKTSQKEDKAEGPAPQESPQGTRR